LYHNVMGVTRRLAGDLSDGARRLAEDAFVYTPRWPTQQWEERDGYFLLHGVSSHHAFGLVLRLRLGADVERVVEEVRAWFAARGRREFTWLVGDSSTPTDLRQRLLRLGARPDAHEPVYAGMVLAEQPPPVEGLEARPVETFEEFAAARELGWDTLGISEEEREGPRSRLSEAWEEYRQVDILVFATFVDGRPVACGGVSFTPYGAYLAGGGTHPDYRGRGCYRALVRARWDAAAARGTPLLAVHAGTMSKPILDRLGFRQIATVHALVDRA
jgi:GNAT superfamily N-acetyltransferase